MCFQKCISYQYPIPLRCSIYLYWQSQLFISNQKIFNLLYNAALLYGGTSLCHMVFTKHLEVGKISCLQWHVSSFELNMRLRDILHHFKPTAEAAASTSVFVHLILGQNTYKCFTTLGALPKHFFGFDVLSRSGQPQLSNLTSIWCTQKVTNLAQSGSDMVEGRGGLWRMPPPRFCIFLQVVLGRPGAKSSTLENLQKKWCAISMFH